jgi:CRISPR/Cas system-associated exonuclease Cas4 (RecB family)
VIQADHRVTKNSATGSALHNVVDTFTTAVKDQKLNMQQKARIMQVQYEAEMKKQGFKPNQDDKRQANEIITSLVQRENESGHVINQVYWKKVDTKRKSLKTFAKKKNEVDEEEREPVEESESSTTTKGPANVWAKYSEQQFMCDMGNFYMNGCWDQIVESDQGVIIKEFKTRLGSRSANDNFQLMVYTVGYEKMFGVRPSLVMLECIKTGASSAFVPDENYVKKSQEVILETVKEIEKGVFKAKPSVGICSRCYYQNFCPMSMAFPT